MAKKAPQFAGLMDIGDQLTQDNVRKLTNFLNIPSGLSEAISSGTKLLSVLKKWDKHSPFMFDQGLQAIGRPDLSETARQYSWLASEHKLEGTATPQEDETSVKSFLRLLKSELAEIDWTRISLIVSGVEDSMSFTSKMRILVKEGYISNDLTELIQLMCEIKRNDVEEKVTKYRHEFRDTSNQIFIAQFENEVRALENEILKWEDSVRKFMEVNNRNVKQMFEDDEPVNLESIYVPLTIVKEKPRPVNLEDETTYNEIAYIRKIANKEIRIEPVNFAEELRQYNPSSPEIWCIIGNPGSGKSFLCHRTGLRFGKGELPQFKYSLSIPCRSQDWHDMETSRDKASQSVHSEFIQQWLCISMPVGPSWTTELAKHLVESDGDRLLLIIDGLDEFTKEVPFQESLLFLLLTRRALTQSSILLTTRPGAYTVMSSSHTFLVDVHYQVLGFSPENRDKYFTLQLTDETKLKQLKRLLYLHDEVSQLSLIPVNASLFAALVRGSDDVTAYTLTHLYTELVTYLIRRQLFRMALKELAKKKQLFQLDASVLDCLYRIGELAYLGVYGRELISSKDILLKVDKVEKSCQCLGLAEEHIQRDDLGRMSRVWSFAHLTIQEYVSAIWLSVSSRGDQCLSTRYIVNSDANFSIFRMVFRFLCGLLSSDSVFPVHFILYKYLPTHPVSMDQMPMKYKYNPIATTDLPQLMGCIEFTQQLVSLSELLFESNSDSLHESFRYFRKFLPETLYLYFESATSPNEWECFVKSLPLLHTIQLIELDTSHLTLAQFRSLVLKLTSCSLSCLAVKLHRQDYSTLSAYCDVITENQLTSHGTKISLDLLRCDYRETNPADYATTSPFQLSTSLSLFYSELSPQCYQQIANQLIHTEYLSLNGSGYDGLELVGGLSTASQLFALHLRTIGDSTHQILQTQLPRLSSLQEITLNGKHCYSLLPHISSVSNLKYLQLSYYKEPINTGHEQHLLQLLSASSHTLKGLRLDYLETIGLRSWDRLLLPLFSCSNLIEIELYDTTLPHDDVTVWRAVNRLSSLLYLFLCSVPLSEHVSSLCTGLLHHPNIRELGVTDCELNSEACVFFTHLIPTLTQLKKLDLHRTNLEIPDSDPVANLKKTAELYSIELRV